MKLTDEEHTAILELRESFKNLPKGLRVELDDDGKVVIWKRIIGENAEDEVYKFGCKKNIVF